MLKIIKFETPVQDKTLRVGLFNLADGRGVVLKTVDEEGNGIQSLLMLTPEGYRLSSTLDPSIGIRLEVGSVAFAGFFQSKPKEA